MKKSAIVSAVLALVLLAAGCTPDGPAGRTWTVRPATVEVVRKSSQITAGDRPYFVQIGFRSKLGVPNSTHVDVVSQCKNNRLPEPDAAPQGTVHTVPEGAADIVFPEAQNLDIGDVLFGTAPLEIFGTLTFAVNRNVVPIFDGSCALGDALQTMIAPTMGSALEALIARSSVPPTQEQLIDLIVSNLGSYLEAIGQLLWSQIEGILSAPDAIVGIGVQILIPTQGAFTDLLNTGFGLAGFLIPQFQNGFVNIDELPALLQIRVGQLTNEAATFDFNGDAGHWRVRMAING